MGKFILGIAGLLVGGCVGSPKGITPVRGFELKELPIRLCLGAGPVVSLVAVTDSGGESGGHRSVPSAIKGARF